jgi:hypothetical protein
LSQRKKADFHFLVNYLSAGIKKLIKMKTRNFLFVLAVALFFSGCVVYSFYPLYTEKDLFENDILTGTWTDGDSILWKFKHPEQEKNGVKTTDNTSYVLTFQEKDGEQTSDTTFLVHIVKLGGNYFLDFYLDDFLNDKSLTIADFHIIPVHTFARLTIKNDTLEINWFDQNWLEGLIKENKIRIHHENNGDFILLTAKSGELQKFVTKYVNSEEAFKDGMEAVLTRK